MQATGGVITTTTPQNLAEGVNYPFEVTLVATETLATSQDSGTNANTLLNAVVVETPI